VLAFPALAKEISQMEPLFRSLIVGLVPQLREVPPPPFNQEDLQRLYMDVSRTYSFGQFSLLPAGGGAQLLNTPEDRLLVQPVLVQAQTPIDLTVDAAREKATGLITTVATRLQLANFVQCGIKVVCHVAVPTRDAKAYAADTLLAGRSLEDELGPSFFVGGLKYRSLEAEPPVEQNLSIEPLLADNEFMFVDYDIQRMFAFGDLGQLGGWIQEAADFVKGQAMSILGGK
jgi:hypothetical protein